MKNTIRNWMQNIVQKKEYWIGLLLGGYLSLFFLLYPILFSTGHYFTLNELKYHLFILSVSLLMVFTVVMNLGSSSVLNLKNLSITDWSFIAFVGIAILSGLSSEYFPDTINGVEGRYHGMLTLFAYLILYFIISRYFEQKYLKIIIFAFVISACLVYLLGIINYANFDPLGFYQDVREDQKTIFISTIGNRNFFSSFVCLSLPCFMVFSLRQKSAASFAKWMVVIFLGFAALCVSNSDSGLLGIGVVFLILIFYSFRNIEELKKIVWIFAVCSASCFIIGVIHRSIPSPRWATSSLLLFFCESAWPIFLTMLFLVAFLILHLLTPYFKNRAFPSKGLRWGTGILLAICVAILFGLLFYFNVINPNYPLGPLAKYLRFSGNWGSKRGSVCAYLISSFCMLNPIHMLIGTGPDTIWQVLQHFFASDMERGILLNFDSAHNEYLQYLITTGLLGCISYSIFVISGIIRQFRFCKPNSYLFAVGLVCVCYAVQGFFNISMITTTPIFIIFMALGEAMIRNKKKNS